MTDTDARVSRQLDAWRTSLIDLTARNRLLNATGTSVVELIGGTTHVLQQLDKTEHGVTLGRSDEPSSGTTQADALPSGTLGALLPDEGQIDDVLKRFERTTTHEFLNRGVHVLFTGLGLVEFPDCENRPVTAPLLLLPVALERRSPRDPFRLRPARRAEPLANPALRVKLDLEVGCALPEIQEHEAIAAYMEQAMALIAQWEEVRYTDRAFLGTFSFHKYPIYRDLGENADAIVRSPLVRALALGEQLERSVAAEVAESIDPPTKPDVLALDADSTQVACIRAAREGRSFVMDGPPGTGKSQTIANMVAGLLYDGRTVLFVAEKPAAIDAVRKRLDTVGLGPYILDLHDSNSQRKETARHLRDSLDSVPEPPSRMSSAELTELAAARRALTGYCTAINEVREPLGLSLFEAVGRATHLGGAATVPVPRLAWPSLTEEQFQAALAAVGCLFSVRHGAGSEAGRLWEDSVDAGDVERRIGSVRAQIATLAGVCERIHQSVAQIADAFGIPADSSSAGVVRSIGLLRIATASCEIDPTWITSPDCDAVSRLASDRQRRWESVAATEKRLDGQYPGWRGLSSDASAQLARAVTKARNLQPQVHFIPRLRPEQVQQRAASLGQLAALVPEVVIKAEELSAVLRPGAVVAGTDLTVKELHELEERGRQHPTAQALRKQLANLERLAVADQSAVDLLSSGPIGAVPVWARQAEAITLELVAALTAMGLPADEDPSAAVAAALATGEHAAELEELTTSMADDRAVIGSAYVGPSTDWTSLMARLAEVGKACEELAAAEALPSVDPDRFARVVALGHMDLPLADWEAQRSAAAQELGLLFKSAARSSVLELVAGPAMDAAVALQDLAADIHLVASSSAQEHAHRTLVDLGLESTCRFAESMGLTGAEATKAVERSVLTGWIDHQLADDGRLTPLAAIERDSLVERFRLLDAASRTEAASLVISAGNRRRTGIAPEDTGVLRTESERSTGHRPLRQLFSEARVAVQAAAPCMMMSPRSVSQFLPPDQMFDVVIFDEASQVRPSDAINSIYRGAQLIVAGDERQMPPTSFFDAVVGEVSGEVDEESIEEFESLLGLCRRSISLESLPLKWHYRSRHESLIEFSNRTFYDDKLVSFPSAVETADDLGVRLIHVPDGIYARGGSRDNEVESRRVVARVLEHAEQHPDQSLGVVAFSEAQALRIERDLDAARQDRADLDGFFSPDRPDPFFINNLESVQGDERDAIVFSVGYGPDKTGSFSATMGPLNRKGGERRLNVAITRARRRVDVISSITSGDIPTTAMSAGVQALRDYLEFAETGGTFTHPDHENTEKGLGLVAEIAARARSEGWHATTDVGRASFRIDLGLALPSTSGSFDLGVMLDGPYYLSARSSSERDHLRFKMLHSLGWRLHTVWSPTWHRDPDGEWERIREAMITAEDSTHRGV